MVGFGWFDWTADESVHREKQQLCQVIFIILQSEPSAFLSETLGLVGDFGQLLLFRQPLAALDSGDPMSQNFPMTNGTSGQGSAGNVIASLASFVLPGLGQLIQGRLLPAILFFLFTGILWFFLLGWVIHLWACLDAALWKPRS